MNIVKALIHFQLNLIKNLIKFHKLKDTNSC